LAGRPKVATPKTNLRIWFLAPWLAIASVLEVGVEHLDPMSWSTGSSWEGRFVISLLIGSRFL